MSETTSTSTSISISALTVLFIGLKLTNQIEWSWWWVLSPLWIPTVMALVILAVGIIIVKSRK